MNLSLKNISVLSSVLLLGACAYLQDDTYQKITFETPGAEGAECHIYVNNLHFPVHVPGTVSIPKSKDDMRVRCLAPGNRVRVTTIASVVASEFNNNFYNGYVGAGWDAVSGAMFKYPDIVRIDFTSMGVKDYPLPKHDAYDLRPSSDYNLEEFLPARSRLNSDRYVRSEPIQRVDRSGGAMGTLDSGLSSAFGATPEQSAARSVLSNDPALPPVLPVNLSDLVETAPLPAPTEDVGADAPVSTGGAFDDDFSRFNNRH